MPTSSRVWTRGQKLRGTSPPPGHGPRGMLQRWSTSSSSGGGIRHPVRFRCSSSIADGHGRARGPVCGVSKRGLGLEGGAATCQAASDGGVRSSQQPPTVHTAPLGGKHQRSTSSISCCCRSFVWSAFCSPVLFAAGNRCPFHPAIGPSSPPSDTSALDSSPRRLRHHPVLSAWNPSCAVDRNRA